MDKPEGPTSHDVVACARRVLGQREAGHTGTLDPMATGVLPLVLGRATRLAQFLSGGTKGYEATIRLGLATDTWDRTGSVVRQQPGDVPLPGEEDIRRALAAMLGEHEQVPPPFSAKRVGGVRAYALARSGQAVAPKAARVALLEATIDAWDPPLLQMRISCSAGFYVRALARDLGERLGCGACLEHLRRFASGTFTSDRAISLESLQRDPALARASIIRLEDLLPQLPSARLTEAGARRAAHGNDVSPADFAEPPVPGAGGLVRLLAPDGQLLAVARPGNEPGTLHPAVVLK